MFPSGFIRLRAKSIMISNLPLFVSDSNSFKIISSDTKLWADYDHDDDILPIIPWAPHIKSVSIKLQSKEPQDFNHNDSHEWTTVKSKKKRK